MSIKAFIFDLDGVIVDTAVYHYKAWKRLANSLDFDIDEVFNEKLKGISRMDSLEAILDFGKISLPDDEKLRLATLKNAWYLEYIEQMTPADVLPGVAIFLAEMQQQGLLCALGSASKNAPHILGKIGLLNYFDAMIDGNLVSQSKPHPEVFLKGAAALQVLPENCIVFEDAVAGIEAAKAAGMKAVGIGSANVLTEADVVWPSFEGRSVKELINHF